MFNAPPLSGGRYPFDSGRISAGSVLDQ